MSDKKDDFNEKLEATFDTLKKRGAELGGKLRETFEHASEDAREAWKKEVKPRLSKAEEMASKAAEHVGSQLNEATEDAIEQVKKKFGELRDEVRDEFGKRSGGSKSDD